MLFSRRIELRLVPRVRDFARVLVTLLVAAVAVTFAPTLNFSVFAASGHAAIPVSAHPRMPGTNPNQRLVDQLQASTSQLKDDVAAGGRSGTTAVLMERHALIQELLRKDPAAVSAQLLSATLAAKAAAAAPLLVERPVTLTGRYAEVHEDGVGGAPSVDHHYLTVFGRSWRNTQRYEIYSADSTTFGHMHPNDSLQITGDAFGSDVLLTHAAHVAPPTSRGSAGSAVTRLFSQPTAEAATTSGTVTTGVIKTAVIAIQFVDAPTPYNMTQLHNVMHDAPNHNVVDYYNQASYGKAQISPDFYGPYTLPSSMTVSGGQCYDSSSLEQAAYQVASTYVTYANYDRIYFAINCRSSNGLGSGGSMGSVGEISISTPEGTVTAGQTFSFDTWGYLSIAAHELGHNFGFGHAQYYDCQPDAFDPPTRFGAPCSTITYGDGFDLMGGKGWLASNWDLAGQVNAAEKNTAAWFGSANVATASTPGTYTYTLAPLENSTASTQAVYIPRGSSGTGFWLEYRQPTGYDSWMTDGTYCAACNITGGPSIRFLDYGDSQTKLIDTTPYSLTANDQRDAALLPGRTITDPEYGIKIATTSASASGTSITVTIPTTATCVRGAPGVAVATPTQSAAPGQSVTYSVTLTDTDSASCSSNTFRTDPPTGLPYTVYATPNIVTLSPGASTTFSITVNDALATVMDSQTGYPFSVQACGDYQSAGCTMFNLTFTQISPADATSPTSPSNMTAQAVGARQVNLSWGASTDDTAVIGYRVYRNGSQIASTRSTSYIDGGASPGTAYTYTVAAYDYKGNLSPSSAGAAVTTPATTDTTAPSAPTSVNVVAQDAHTVQINWSPATDNVGVTRYVISGGAGTYSLPASATSFSDTGLAASTQYTYYVYAYDGSGNRTYYNTSNTVVYTPKEGSTAPSRPRITSHVQVTPTRDDVFYTTSTSSSGPVTYRYFRDGREVGTSTVPAISDTHYPNDGAAHYDYVQAVDSVGNIAQSPLSNGWNIGAIGSTSDTTSPTAALTSPASGASVSGSSTATVSAADNTVISGAELYLDGQLVGAVTPSTLATTATFTVGWSTDGWTVGNHTLTAKAYDGNGGNVGTSGGVTVNVTGASSDTTPPTSPTGVTAVASGPTTVDLSWNAATDNVGVTGYEVLRNGAVVASLGNVTGWSDNSVSAATTYSYQVVALDAAGNTSTASSTAAVTTPSAPDTSAPTTPTGVTATAVSATQVNLSWAASSDNVGVTGYKVIRNGSSVATVGAVTSWSDTTATPATTYSYQVVALDAAGNASAASAPVSVTTPAQAAAAASITGTVTANGVPLAGAKVSTTVSGVTESVTTAGDGSYTLGSLPPGTYTLTFSAKGYTKRKVTVTVTGGSTAVVNMAM